VHRRLSTQWQIPVYRRLVFVHRVRKRSHKKKYQERQKEESTDFVCLLPVSLRLEPCSSNSCVGLKSILTGCIRTTSEICGSERRRSRRRRCGTAYTRPLFTPASRPWLGSAAQILPVSQRSPMYMASTGSASKRRSRWSTS
jgi:hypothetical protein